MKGSKKKKNAAETGLREHWKVPGWRSEGKDPFSRELCNVTFEQNERRSFENGCGFQSQSGAICNGILVPVGISFGLHNVST